MTLAVAVERHRSADRINAIINERDVRPWVANGTEPIDITPQVENNSNILLMGDHGGCMFYRVVSGIYEVHTQVQRQGRGEWTRGLTDSCAHWMFTRTDCFEIVTRVPAGHFAAKAAALAAGMRHEFTRPGECHFRNRMVDAHIYSYRIQDWAQNAPGVVDTGRAFHDALHREADRLGVTDAAHDDDENHNRYVGVAVDMARGGQILKGANFYNRWAIVSRHDPIRVISSQPTVIAIDHGLVVTILPDGIEVSKP